MDRSSSLCLNFSLSHSHSHSHFLIHSLSPALHLRFSPKDLESSLSWIVLAPRSGTLHRQRIAFLFLFLCPGGSYTNATVSTKQYLVPILFLKSTTPASPLRRPHVAAIAFRGTAFTSTPRRPLARCPTSRVRPSCLQFTVPTCSCSSPLAHL